MTAPLLALLERLVSQEAARTNAAQASVRLVHARRQLEHVEAFLTQHLRKPTTRQQPASAETTPDTGIGRRPGL